jgi:malonyl-CoA O-methyltransferase
MMNKQQVSRHFGKMANCYDEFAVVQKDMAYQLKNLLKQPKDFFRILEIGCGTGFFTDLLAQRFPESRIIATDISERMLEAAGKRLQKYANIQYAVEDGENLTMEGPFDLIVSNAAFQWFQSYHKAFQGFYERLLPGGCILYATFGKDTFYELDDSFRKAGRILGIQSPARHGPEFIAQVDLAAIAEGLGLSVDCKEVYKRQYFSHVKEFLAAIKKVGANNAAKSENILINRRLMLSMMEQYERNFNRQGQIQATYHIIYGKHVKADSLIGKR